MKIENCKLEIVILTLLLSAFSVLPTLGQTQDVNQEKVSISPALFELNAKPGDTLDNSMKVINTSDQIQDYEMEIKPFVGNEFGQAKIVADDDLIGTDFGS